MTLQDIATELGVAKSSVSLWVRDVPFTPSKRRTGPRRRPHPMHEAKLAQIAARYVEREGIDVKAELAKLEKSQGDAFNRFDAASILAMRDLVARAAAFRARRNPPSPDALTSAFALTLDDHRLDPAFVAQVIAVPSEADIAHEIGSDVDPDAILVARKTLKRTLGETLAARCQKIYEQVSPRAPYSPGAASAGRRALKNA